MLDEKVFKLKYIDFNGNSIEKWVNEFALFDVIKQLEKEGCNSIVIA